ncbi:MAG: hypothetical protein EP318_16395 [Rhodobacteraceae bacterium]|nr:MAG: hypothetical protein EP318_16395 [Paracoccaceae bacterium]
MRRVVILTGHFPEQKRKPSMLWVAHHLQEMGWHVTLATVGYSWLSRLTGDKRLAHEPQPGTRFRSETLTTIFHWSPLHPVSTRRPGLDALLSPLHQLFPAFWGPVLEPHLAQAALVLIESGAPVMLAPLARRFAPKARLVYRVNDDMRLIKAPRALLMAEARAAKLVDRISTASPHLARRFHPGKVTLDPMGIPQRLLQVSNPDPYTPRARFEAVCAGTTLLDLPALVRIASEAPHWRLHVLGPTGFACETPANLVLHGEKSHADTLAFIAHADIGLAPYRDAPGIEYQTHNSNRIGLYRHVGLPILGPDRLCHPSAPSIIGYADPDWRFRCETRGKRPESLPDWSDLARRLVQKGVTVPPLEVSILPEIA